VNALDSWDAADIEEIGETVSPWFGNTFSDRHNEPPTEWVDRYEYYTLWELFEKVAAVFRAKNRATTHSRRFTRTCWQRSRRTSRRKRSARPRSWRG